MRRFLSKTAAFFAALLLLSLALNTAVPYHWGNVWFSTKIRYLEQTSDQQNAYFFGSSRIYRHLNPAVFDRVVEANSQRELSTFNLGAPATFSPQTYFLLSKFIESDLAIETEAIFLELSSVEGLGSDVLHQERTSYWQNWKDSVFVTRVMAERKDRDIFRQTKNALTYWLSYIENLFNVGQFRDMLLSPDYFKAEYLGTRRDGFYSLEAELKTTKNEALKAGLLLKREGLVESKIQKRRAEIEKAFGNEYNRVSPTHINRIRELIEAAADRDIRLVFVITPCQLNEQVVSLHDAIPEHNRLPVDYLKLHRELYRKEFLFNIGHFNDEGSRRWTEHLAKAYSLLL